MKPKRLGSENGKVLWGELPSPSPEDKQKGTPGDHLETSCMFPAVGGTQYKSVQSLPEKHDGQGAE